MIPNGWHQGDCSDFGCRVFYKCSEGYELAGKSERLCHSDGYWVPKDLPACVRKYFNAEFVYGRSLPTREQFLTVTVHTNHISRFLSSCSSPQYSIDDINLYLYSNTKNNQVDARTHCLNTPNSFVIINLRINVLYIYPYYELEAVCTQCIINEHKSTPIPPLKKLNIK